MQFLGYFSLLLVTSVLCVYFYLNTSNVFANSMEYKRKEAELYISKEAEITARIDSINSFLHLLHTRQVRNDAALESTILKLKYNTLKEIDKIPQPLAQNFNLHKKMLMNIEPVLDAKKILHDAAIEEGVNKKKLMDCNIANQKLTNK